MDITMELVGYINVRCKIHMRSFRNKIQQNPLSLYHLPKLTHFSGPKFEFSDWFISNLTLKVPVTVIDALRHFETG